jgi:hypothetical protein
VTLAISRIVPSRRYKSLLSPLDSTGATQWLEWA